MLLEWVLLASACTPCASPPVLLEVEPLPSLPVVSSAVPGDDVEPPSTSTAAATESELPSESGEVGASDEGSPDIVGIIREGDRCRNDSDHACAVDRYAEAYDRMEPSDRLRRSNRRLVLLMGESCEALASSKEHEQRLETCVDVIEAHLSRIEAAPKQRRAYRSQTVVLEALVGRLKQKLDDIRELPVVVSEPEPEPVRVPDETTEPPIHEPPPPSNRPSSSKVKEDTRVAFVLGTIGIVGGTLAVLSGTSLIVNGAAWNACSKKYRDKNGIASSRCVDLLGVAQGFDLSEIFKSGDYSAEDYDRSERDARKNSARSWVSGSIALAVAVTGITWGAVAVKRARDKRKLAVTAGWSPGSAEVGLAYRF